MPVVHLKITDSTELLKKHFLCCDKRSALYLEQVAEQTAIKNAVDNGWLEYNFINEAQEYYITKTGKSLLYSKNN